MSVAPALSAVRTEEGTQGYECQLRRPGASPGAFRREQGPASALLEPGESSAALNVCCVKSQNLWCLVTVAVGT